MAEACVFCDIVAGVKPAQRVFEDSNLVAFLDAKPLFKGHTLVVPRVHLETLPELPAAQLQPFFAGVQRVMVAVEKGLGADGIFLANNNKVSQSVPHLHVHVIPRRKGDGLKGFFWPRSKYAGPEEAEGFAARIRGALGV